MVHGPSVRLLRVPHANSGYQGQERSQYRDSSLSHEGANGFFAKIQNKNSLLLLGFTTVLLAAACVCEQLMFHSLSLRFGQHPFSAGNLNSLQALLEHESTSMGPAQRRSADCDKIAARSQLFLANSGHAFSEFSEFFIRQKCAVETYSVARFSCTVLCEPSAIRPRPDP